MKERLAVHLRVIEGVDLELLNAPLDSLKSIEHLSEIGLLQRMGTRVQLTEQGRLLYDRVAEELI